MHRIIVMFKHVALIFPIRGPTRKSSQTNQKYPTVLGQGCPSGHGKLYCWSLISANACKRLTRTYITETTNICFRLQCHCKIICKIIQLEKQVWARFECTAVHVCMRWHVSFHLLFVISAYCSILNWALIKKWIEWFSFFPLVSGV